MCFLKNCAIGAFESEILKYIIYLPLQPLKKSHLKRGTGVMLRSFTGGAFADFSKPFSPMKHVYLAPGYPSAMSSYEEYSS